ncbi:hypothetical protein LTR70_002931 [Exophiala xenobiotica]|uniref:Exosome complex protein n=1 Tax=Lithohypha guttulata TaxID=1690604 RepID=A0ABR0KHM0_9EURO|nr:hypothetical protein LTR24_002461 [Lithohypha guttulata]KAK5324484.1 hypothetical protein LTR70_002931 [Exophiala xenobiotica]
MESKALLALVDQLDGNLDGLEEALDPLLQDSLSATTKRLPILDRAKLNITVVYAVESLLFSYLRINGVNAVEHPVFKELQRVKQYFGKVKEAEEKVSGARPSTTLNKQAAARIIQHSLAGNGTSDMTQREKELKERLLAKRLQKNNANPAPVSIPVPVTAAVGASAAAADATEVLDSIAKEIEMLDGEGSEEGEIEEDPETQHPISNIPLDTKSDQPSGKKRKHNASQSGQQPTGTRADKKARKKAKKGKKAAAADAGTGG